MSQWTLGFSTACLPLFLGLIAPFATQAAEPRKAAKAPTDLAGYDALVTKEDREHWAFQPVRTPPVPEVKNHAWARNPIDRFVLAGLEEKGWSPATPAGARALLRRLYLDLIGLPPTVAEQEAFLDAYGKVPDAWDRLVDDLLSRPTYGERWGRHWLDLVRFAESNGYERDAAKPFAWRYRDYVIRAFNDDKPFDRFAIEQLAGDELPDGQVSAETLVATGYYRMGPWDDEPADPAQDRSDQLDDVVATTSEVFLGLTLACARCHNHKFEPLTQHDYYRMVAVFQPLQRPRKGRDEVARPIGTESQIQAQAERDAKIADAERSLAEAKTRPGSPERAAKIVAMETTIRQLRKATPDLPQGYFLQEPEVAPAATHLLLRGQALTPGPAVKPGVPSVLAEKQPGIPERSPGRKTSGRRLALAKWVASPDHPLTARVIVNRVWQGHFGVGLVRTSSDFGTMGEAPTHPELLDWLASRFVEHGWSIKKLHRLILTSATYQMSTRNRASQAAEDPDNLLLWRRPYRRLEVEAIRDSTLAASGRLDRTMYGPSVYPYVPPEALEGNSDPDKVWVSSDDATASRRTIYAFIKRSLVVPMLELLDFCDTTRSTAKRNVTSVPTQALSLLNGDFGNRQADHFASRLEREVGSDASEQVRRAFLLTVCRPPTDAELKGIVAFLDRETEERMGEAKQPAAVARHAALVQACRALFNSNEFVYPD